MTKHSSHKPTRRARLHVEELEPRLAPANFQFLDVDGDVVTVTCSKGTNADLQAATHLQATGFLVAQLTELDVSSTTWGNVFAGAIINISVTKLGPQADGLVNVGWINATGIDLGAVNVKGDLGVIWAGAANTTTPALASLTVQSLGRFGTTTGAPSNTNGTLESDITGPLGALHVKNDVVGAFVNVSGLNNGTIGTVTIGGSLLGGPTTNSGLIESVVAIGPIMVGGDVVGGAGDSSGGIRSLKLTSVTVGGSLLGGSNTDSGEIATTGGDIGAMKIGHDVVGGRAVRSGLIEGGGSIGSASIGGSIVGTLDISGVLNCHDRLGPVVIGQDVIGGTGESGDILAASLSSLRIGGSLLGGSGLLSGRVESTGAVGSVNIAHDIRGGSGEGSGTISTTIGSIAAVTIGGSLVGGTFVPTGPTNLDATGAILSGGDLGNIVIGGSIVGSTGDNSGSIRGFDNVGSVTVAGSLVGGSNSSGLKESGAIDSVLNMGVVTIDGSVIGGTGVPGSNSASGIINCHGNLAGVNIGGSLLGGSGGNSGQIVAHGTLGAVVVGQDIRGSSGLNSGSIFGLGPMLARVAVGGSVIGGSNGASGQIVASHALGNVSVAHDVRGGTDIFTGRIASGGKLGAVNIGGALVGGLGDSSGQVFSGSDMGSVAIRGGVTGGMGMGSGAINAEGKLAGVDIGGSLVGGSIQNSSGEILSSGDMGPVKIGGDLAGGSISAGQGTLTSSGLIESFNGRITSVTIGGSILSGVNNTTNADLVNNASIRAANDIGSLTVGGSVIGNISATGRASPVYITARGQAVQGATTDLAIGRISIGGRVENTQFLAGYDIDLNAANADAQIGSVSVGGDWIASSIAAGATPGSNGWGSGDVKMSGPGVTDNPAILSRIAAVAIAGDIIGAAGVDFGFVAEGVGSFNLGGINIPLKGGAHNDDRLFGSTQVFIHET
jgi:hypothetical protein